MPSHPPPNLKRTTSSNLPSANLTYHFSVLGIIGLDGEAGESALERRAGFFIG
jgi:hypothetical protein